MKLVHDALTKKFGDSVYVNMNQGGDSMVLNVTFINSALNTKAPEDRFTRAQETANLIRARYPGINNLNAIWIVFVREKTTLILFHEREAIDYYGFDKEAKRLSLPSGLNSYGVELRTATSYLDKTNESDISVSGIQLAGIPGEKGLTVLPHFTVSGDVRAAQSRPPRAVSFDFASYADAEQFGANVPIAFIADGKIVLQTTGTFSVSRFSGTVSEFCYLAVPYPAFRKVIAAKQLTIKLGDKEYPLTSYQFAAVRQMGNYIAE